MGQQMKTPSLIELDIGSSIWENFFSVFPLVIIGTREADGSDDLAPKHLAMPMSWSNHFGFVCTPRHNTLQNIKRTQQFSVTYMRPSHTVLATQKIDAAFVADGYLFLECELQQMVDNLGDNSLIIGRIIAAQVAEDAFRTSDQDDADLLINTPLLAYLYPGRFAEISSSTQLPFPAGFKR